MTDRCKSCDHDTQAHYPDGSGCGYVIATLVDVDPICPCTHEAYSGPSARHPKVTRPDCHLEPAT